MRVEAFHFDLPDDLIAQHPAARREDARLMVVPAGASEPQHRRIADLPELAERGSLFVVNDTRVIPARLLGRKRTGGKIEWLLVERRSAREIEVAPREPRAGEHWRALGKGVASIQPGETFEIAPRGDAADGASRLMLTALGRSPVDGLWEVFLWTSSDRAIRDLLDACGHVPLPPYIRRADLDEDGARYQTVYARHDGAVAAPTAGLHLTNALIEQLASHGCDMTSITLHVGLGTFLPVQAGDLDEHPMHAEAFHVSEHAAQAIARARARRAPVVAVGTTSARALESAADMSRPGEVRPANGETRLLIQPGHRWRVVDALLTNFHQPRSTLMALVCSFAGTERVLAAYADAVRERYRFFSYGDAMLLRRAV
jgi:S-adenosylmethionine:tRNA ribosyltransferase-isomerase